MTPHEHLRAAIDREQQRLMASVPSTRRPAILALLRAQDRLLQRLRDTPAPDIISGQRLANPGGNKALHLCFAATAGVTREEVVGAGGDLADWGERFLTGCAELARADMVLGHCETGFMALAEAETGSFHAWITTKRVPTIWQERADIDWWARSLAGHDTPEGPASHATPSSESDDRRASALLQRMGYQLGYPPDAEIDGCSVRNYCAVLSRLIAWTLEACERDEQPAPTSRAALVTRLTAALRLDSATVARALAAFTLDEENAAYHAAVPGVAAAPLVYLGNDEIVCSRYGLLTEPLFFLARELRRRATQEYSNTAFHREIVFRQDLYVLFQDKRFVTSSTKIELRRAAGDVRTDIDAVVFDRKTGALAFFELKSQDPFARSTAEFTRQRDNLLYANRQISGALAWLQHHGADALLQRVDARSARTFRAYKVYPFVLGRYLAHFNDGPEPDRRAAWGTWPQLLRLLEGQPPLAGLANPLASLHNRLAKDTPALIVPNDAREIDLGGAQLTVHPSYAAWQGNAGRTR